MVLGQCTADRTVRDRVARQCSPWTSGPTWPHRGLLIDRWSMPWWTARCSRCFHIRWSSLRTPTDAFIDAATDRVLLREAMRGLARAHRAAVAAGEPALGRAVDPRLGHQPGR
jgi:hypothetical protein